ncbi:NepR family anti-sigma factor [Microvirga zambiensis]|uniref:NepR family anti-sigma factor n=1 Tax=Microvirga zambiensis TaxID=1402137 RepID=UPI00191F01CE|nr:NepR family anti-sigma factor [Microvirga zambiensis]
MSDGGSRVEGTLALASAAGGGGDNKPPDHKLSRSSLTSLGNRLRAMYDREMGEPLPQYLLDLLNQKGSPSNPTSTL